MPICYPTQWVPWVFTVKLLWCCSKHKAPECPEKLATLHSIQSYEEIQTRYDYLKGYFNATFVFIKLKDVLHFFFLFIYVLYFY